VKLSVLRQLLAPYPWALPGLIVLGFMASLAEGLSIGVLIPILHSVLDPAPVESDGPFAVWMTTYAESFNQESRLFILCSTIFGLIAIKAMVTFAHTYMGEWLNGRTAHDLRTRLARLLLRVDYTFILQQPAGRLIDTLEHQTWRAGQVFSCLSALVVTGATVLVFSGLLLLTSWRVSLAIGIGVLLASSLLFVLTRRGKRLGEEAVASSQALVARMVDLLDSMRVVRAFGQEHREHDRFQSLSDRERRTYMAMDLTAAMVNPLMEVLYVPLLLAAVVMAWSAGTSPTVLVACLVLFYRLQPKIQHFQKARVQLASLLGAVDDIGELLRPDNKPFLKSGQQPFVRLEESIEFEDVGFRYAPRRDAASDKSELPPEQHAVRGLSFRIERGQMVAIVGVSGAGKSTIVNLLCRFCDPQEGGILVDGVALPDLDTAAWRSRIAIAGQDADLITGSIAENIAYGRPDAARERIEEAARTAEAHDFIASMPDGYDTYIGSRGRTLSEGQRRRISLARALLTDPCVLVLDEVMSGLDNVTSAAVAATLERLRGELTIVMISHRLQSVLHADHIVVLSEGRIVEKGTYAELDTDGGVFGHLLALEMSRQA